MSKLSTLMIGNGSLLIQCSEILLERGHEISAVVTQSTDISDWARAKDIELLEPGTGLEKRLESLRFDWLFSIANLTMIPPAVLAMANEGAINFHDAILPKYAGINTPVWALLNGEKQHGITWHMMEAGVDEGDILAQQIVDIETGETAFSLNAKCFAAALDSFAPLVMDIEAGTLQRQTQDLSERSYFARDTKPENGGIIDFNRTAEHIVTLVHALDHGPYWNPVTSAKILSAKEVTLVGKVRFEGHATDAAPGTLLAVTETSLTIATGTRPVMFEGLTDQNGQPCTPLQRFTVGDVIPDIDARFAQTYLQSMALAAKTEAKFRTHLTGLIPAKCKLAKGSNRKPDFHKLEVAVPDKMPMQNVLAVAAMWSARMSGKTASDLAYRHADHVKNADTRLFAKWLPLRVDPLAQNNTVNDLITLTNAPLSSLRKAWPYCADLLARDLAIQAITMPDFGLIEGIESRPINGTAVSIQLLPEAIEFHYDSNRLSKMAAITLAARLQGYLDASTDGDLPVADLPTLPESERRVLLDDLNQTSTIFDEKLCIHEMFEIQAKKTPDDIAVVFEAQSLTYRALNERANQLAHVLIEMGAKPDHFIGLFSHRSLDLMIGALAIQKAGAAYVPLDPAFPTARLAHYIKDSNLGIIVSQGSLVGELPAHKAAIIQLDTDPRVQSADIRNPDKGVKSDNLAYLIYTSGSTGTPKGVMVEHRNVSNFFTGMDARVKRNKAGHNTWLALTSLSFDISVLELFYTLARGFKVVIAGENKGAGLSSPGQTISDTPMDFSLYYWGNDDGVGPKKYELLLEGAKFADKNGFTALWTPERHFHAFGGPYPNPSVTGAAVAAVTKNLSVRAGSCVAPLHHTARIAEEWAVIDNLTNGRAGLAIASGWQPDDFVLNPANSPPDNKPAMTQAIKDLRCLWRGESVEFAKKDGSMHAVITQPRPVSKELPIWVTTAGNPATWVEAGELGANILTHLLGQSVEEVADKIKLYHTALEKAGYDPADFKVTLMLHSFVGKDRETVRQIAREPMKDYLRAAAGLIKQYAWAFPAFKRPKGVKNAFDLDLEGLTEDELESILDFAFQRYFEDAGLFGTVEDCIARAESLKKIGVTEIACLIDYGISVPEVLEGLHPLAEVLRKVNQPSQIAEDDFSIAAQIKRHKVTHLQCTPSMAQLLVSDEATRAAFDQVEQVFLGGEALAGTLVKEVSNITKATVQNMYGPTETTIWSATELASPDENVVNIGTPIANTQLYVLDETLKPLGFGNAGELFIAGAGVTRGYWQQDKLTDERFLHDPFAKNPQKMYRTGDLVRRRLDGKIDFLGRMDHQVKLRGYRIELGEIEAALELESSIQQAIVVAREDVPGDKRLVAYLRSTVEISERKLRRALGTSLPEYMVPSRFFRMDHFPLTPNRKIDRAALPVPTASAAPKQAAIETMNTGLASEIAEIWSRVLGVKKIGAKDNFFDLGGHSLLAVQVHREIREKLDLPKLSITDIFRFPVLQTLADHLNGNPLVKKPIQQAQKATGTSEIVVGRAQNRSEAMAKRRAMRARRLGG